MPLKTVTVDGKKMYKWGDKGKLYHSKSKALRQGRAIEASKVRRNNPGHNSGPKVY